MVFQAGFQAVFLPVELAPRAAGLVSQFSHIPLVTIDEITLPISTGLVRNGGLRLCETVPRPAFLWPRGEVTQPTALFLSTPLFSGRNHLLCKDEEPFLLIVSNSDCMCVWFCEKHWLSRDISQWPKSYSVLSVQHLKNPSVEIYASYSECQLN